MSQKQLDNLYKELYFKEDKTDSDEEKFAAISAALAPSAVLQRRLRQAAQAQPGDPSQSLQGEQAAASSSGSITAQGDLGQH